ncbi:DEAD/DEAH box helicase [Streptomyces sp. F-3]|uniref:DEAD/DEAH box helicase n=1 Tax=Streptomyces sp. F-3 TaxID=1840095 RepID=UPI00082A885C|nr:DEAD/DEAH box helicase [Streptomyces sp. F-3]
MSLTVDHALLPETADDAPGNREVSGITFADLGLPEGIVRKLAQNGVTTPFPIQAATIPDALAGKDILGRGRTGSGKTLSFGLPTLAALAGGRTERKRPRAVILTPTRELAMQVADALQPYGDVLGLRMKVVCGGTSMGNQIHALERGVDILVATPGRLRDLIGRGACSLEDVRITVLDEADQMSDLGFLPEVTELLDQIPAGGQRMLFSATMEDEIQTLVDRYLNDPVSHEVDAAQGAVTTMSHHILIVKPKDKAPVTAAIASRKGRTIVFVRTQLGADRVAEQLRGTGARAEALHGGMTQGARTRTLADFKDGYIDVLVATDVAARGIHVDDIDLVLNVDPAGDHKDYLHRAGRTARAGRTGTVVSLALPHQRRQIFRLMEDAGVEATRHVIQGGGVFDPEVAEITGARSMTEVQAEAASNAAQQAEREVVRLTEQLEHARRRAAELREEADRLIAKAARERGADPGAAVAGAQAAAEVPLPQQPGAPDEERDAWAGREERTAAPSHDRRERRDDRGVRRDDRDRFFDRDRAGRSYDRREERGGFHRDRDDRGGFRRDDRGYERRDDRGGRTFDRDRDRERGYERRDDRGVRRDDRDRFFDRDRAGRSYDRREERGGFHRDRDDRGGFRRDDRGYERRDDRGGRTFDRDRDRERGYERRDDRGVRRDDRDRFFDRDRAGRSYDRREERGGFHRDRDERGGFRRDDRGYERRDDRGGFRREERGGHRGSDRPFNRDRQGGRPGFRSGHERPYGRRDDHRGGGSFGRREDKPRWRRSG